eukprot:289602-Amphidinium_carterae.1
MSVVSVMTLRLDLSGNNLGDRACEKLCDALMRKCHASLRDLALARNGIGAHDEVSSEHSIIETWPLLLFLSVCSCSAFQSLGIALLLTHSAHHHFGSFNYIASLFDKSKQTILASAVLLKSVFKQFL